MQLKRLEDNRVVLEYRSLRITMVSQRNFGNMACVCLISRFPGPGSVCYVLNLKKIGKRDLFTFSELGATSLSFWTDIKTFGKDGPTNFSLKVHTKA